MGKIKITSENTQTLKSNEVFVFGSNLAGQHLGGAALLAKEKFGWMDTIQPDTLENNLKKTIDWYNENKHLIK